MASVKATLRGGRELAPVNPLRELAPVNPLELAPVNPLLPPVAYDPLIAEKEEARSSMSWGAGGGGRLPRP